MARNTNYLIILLSKVNLENSTGEQFKEGKIFTAPPYGMDEIENSPSIHHGQWLDLLSSRSISLPSGMTGMRIRWEDQKHHVSQEGPRPLQWQSCAEGRKERGLSSSGNSITLPQGRIHRLPSQLSNLQHPPRPPS